MNRNTEIILNGEDFASFRERIIKQCKKADACEEEFKRLLNADNANSFCQVLIDNYRWCLKNKILAIEQVCKLEGLTSLWCYNNQLTSLPELPEGLTSLWCYNNELTSLPALPEGLTSLDCYNNQLTSLPELPDGLKELVCYNNPLIIERVPASLKELWCNKSQLSPSFKKHEGLRIFYV